MKENLLPLWKKIAFSLLIFFSRRRTLILSRRSYLSHRAPNTTFF